jgi:hypothetical protein
LRKSFQNFTSKNYLFLAIMLVGIIHGVIYLIVVPPWGHYDEPTHFEYAWMIANRNDFPKAGEYDAALRRQILESMLMHRFYELRGWDADLAHLHDPVNIGINQIGDPPVYYFLASIPLRFMRLQSIDAQMLACRFVSFLLFLLAVLVGWKFSGEIAREGNPIRWMIPLSMVLMPALVELMTAVSNDSAAVLVFSLFLYFSIKLIKYGPHLRTILTLVLLVVIGLFTKSSTWLMGIAFLIALILSFFREKRMLIGWGIVVIGILVSFLILFEWGDAALWYRSTEQNEPTREEVQINGNSSYAIDLVDESADYSPALYQTLINGDVNEISGAVVTIGAWMWADQPVEAYPPRFMFINSKGQKWIRTRPVMLTTQPTFFTYKVRLPVEPGRAYIVLKPFDDGTKTGKIYYFNPVLAQGRYNLTKIPNFSDVNASRGEWAGRSFKNLVRNAGTIQAWPKFRDYVYIFANAIDYRLAEGLGHVIYSLDYKGTAWYSKTTLAVIFRSFWAKFGWGEITLMGAKPYRALYIAMIVMLIGCLLGFRKKLSWSGLQIFLWLSLNIFFSLGYAWFTGISMNSYIDRPSIPVARFIFPTIFAILAIFNFGWENWIELIHARYRWIGYAIFIGLFVTLDVLSVMTVYGYYWG